MFLAYCPSSCQLRMGDGERQVFARHSHEVAEAVKRSHAYEPLVVVPADPFSRSLSTARAP